MQQDYTLTDIVRGDQRYRESLHVTVEGNECEHHSEDALPLVVDLWLNRKTQEEPDVGEDAAGFPACRNMADYQD